MDEGAVAWVNYRLCGSSELLRTDEQQLVILVKMDPRHIW